MEVRRGEVYWVDFGEIRGSEMAHKHPALVISINSLNRLGFVIVVVPGTSASKRQDYPTDVRVSPADSGLHDDTVFKCHQLVAVDPKRLLGSPVGTIPDTAMQRVDDTVAYILGLGITP